MKRWIIRSFFVAMVMLFVGGWAAIYSYDIGLGYERGDRFWWAGSSRGCAYLGLSRQFLAPSTTGWRFIVNPNDSQGFFMQRQWPMQLEFLGFGLEDRAVEILGHPAFVPWFSVRVPFWFCTLVSGVLFWCGWRKTRVRTKGPAFPVEVVKAMDAR
jgi:hypothetical protein